MLTDQAWDKYGVEMAEGDTVYSTLGNNPAMPEPVRYRIMSVSGDTVHGSSRYGGLTAKAYTWVRLPDGTPPDRV